MRIENTADRRLMASAVRALAIRALGPGIAFAMSVLIVRLLGAEGSGVFYLASTLVLAGAVAGRCGLDTTLLRFAGAAWGSGDPAGVMGLKRNAIRITTLVGAAMTLTIVTSADWLSRAVFAEPELGEVMKVASFAIVPSALINLQASLLKSIARPGRAALVEGVAMPLLVTSLLALAMLFVSVDATVVAGCYLAGTILTALLAGRILAHCLPAAEAVHRLPLRGLMKSAVPLLWVDLMNFALVWALLLLIGVLASSSEVGIYNAAQRLTMQVGLLVTLFGSVTAPRFAALHADKHLETIDRLAVRTTRYVSLLASPFLVILLVWPEPVLALFGPEFRSAATPVRVLAMGQLVNALSGPVGYLLVVTGHERDLRNCQIVTVCLVLALGTVLIGHHGAIGAAIAGSVALVFNNLASLWLVHHRTGLRLHPGRLLKYAL